MVNLNIVGYDKEKGECELYHMDYLAAAVKVNYAAHGYGGFFTTAILDAHYRKGERAFLPGRVQNANLFFLRNIYIMLATFLFNYILTSDIPPT